MSQRPTAETSRVALAASAFAALTLAAALGCGPAGPDVKPLPRAFQNIKLGATMNEVKGLTPHQQPAPDLLTIETPTDQIEKIECRFTSDGGHLFDMKLSHFLMENTTWEQHLQTLIKRYGAPNRTEDKKADDRQPFATSYAHWETKDTMYSVKADRVGTGGTRLSVTERIIDAQFLAAQQRMTTEGNARDKRDLLNSGGF